MARWQNLLVVMLWLGVFASRGSAQLAPGQLRLSVDADVLSVAWTKLVPPSGAARKQTTVGIGPNQFGASEVALPSAPVGFGVGYVLRPKLLLGARFGFGYDRVSEAGDTPSQSYLTWTLMPGITYVRSGERAKVFFNFSPLLELTRRKQEAQQQVRFGGCYSLGGGTFVFVTPSASIDLGLYFEGRFPDIDAKPKSRTELSDLRWLLRAGLSLWR